MKEMLGALGRIFAFVGFIGSPFVSYYTRTHTPVILIVALAALGVILLFISACLPKR